MLRQMCLHHNVVEQMCAINQIVVDKLVTLIHSLVIHNVATDVSYHNVATMLSTVAFDTRGVWSRAHIPGVAGPQ